MQNGDYQTGMKCILDDMSTLKDDVYVAGGH